MGGGDVYGSPSRVDQAMDVLRTDHSAVNGVELYVQTLNDALQTQCAVLRGRDRKNFDFDQSLDSGKKAVHGGDAPPFFGNFVQPV
ncbi:hypothetical protein TNCV_4351191 [Trichonephila clavipes]|nr:hypothetical protein TNCV_4351191 [Trichonephila clavipes]